LMGHKDIRMTLQYPYLSSDHKQQAVCALEPLAEESPRFSHRDREGDSDAYKSMRNTALP